jgi:hypothetical protein
MPRDHRQPTLPFDLAKYKLTPPPPITVIIVLVRAKSMPFGNLDPSACYGLVTGSR